MQGLSLQAQGRSLVRDLDWQVGLGERWAILGRNAAGKSTLLRALAGLPVPQRQGRVRWFGRDQGSCAPADAARLRAFVPQQARDRFALPVGQLLEMVRVVPEPPGAGPIEAEVAGPGAPAGPEAGPTRQTRRMLEALDVADLLARRLTELSGGERQRVALAAAAQQGAALMLMDEPVAFQDPAHAAQIARWLAGWPQRALIFTAHDVNWVARAATHVLLLMPDGEHAQGPWASMLEPARLERAYGCGWRITTDAQGRRHFQPE